HIGLIRKRGNERIVSAQLRAFAAQQTQDRKRRGVAEIVGSLFKGNSQHRDASAAKIPYGVLYHSDERLRTPLVYFKHRVQQVRGDAAVFSIDPQRGHVLRKTAAAKSATRSEISHQARTYRRVSLDRRGDSAIQMQPVQDLIDVGALGRFAQGCDLV